MPSEPSDLRLSLAAEQRALLEALMRTVAAPGGFDTEQFAAARDALAGKRARSVARAWPGLARGLGDSYFDTFRAFAETHPLPHHGGPLADGLAFSRQLALLNVLPKPVDWRPSPSGCSMSSVGLVSCDAAVRHSYGECFNGRVAS
jgi:hypothetical protein